MDPENIRGKITTRLFGRELYYFDSLDSTNLAAKKFASDGAPEGSVIIAEEQTAGAGRQGRSWDSEPGRDLTFSVILRPEIDPPRIGVLSLFASVCVAAAVEKLSGVKAALKWPNDVLLPEKKVSGILSESMFSGGNPVTVVVGVGVNVNREHFPPDIAGKATSMRAAAGRDFDLGETLSAILVEMESRYPFGASGGRTPGAVLDDLIGEWTARSVVLGRTITVEQAGETVTGRAVSVAGDGSLMLDTAAGPRAIVAGDVHLI